MGGGKYIVNSQAVIRVIYVDIEDEDIAANNSDDFMVVVDDDIKDIEDQNIKGVILLTIDAKSE